METNRSSFSSGSGNPRHSCMTRLRNERLIEQRDSLAQTADCPKQANSPFAVLLLAVAIAANGLDWTSLHSLFAQRFFVRILRLFINIGVTTVVVARKICRRRLPTKVAIDALVINVESTSSILRILICNVSHILLFVSLVIPGCRLSRAVFLQTFSKAC